MGYLSDLFSGDDETLRQMSREQYAARRQRDINPFGLPYGPPTPPPEVVPSQSLGPFQSDEDPPQADGARFGGWRNILNPYRIPIESGERAIQGLLGNSKLVDKVNAFSGEVLKGIPLPIERVQSMVDAATMGGEGRLVDRAAALREADANKLKEYEESDPELAALGRGLGVGISTLVPIAPALRAAGLIGGGVRGTLGAVANLSGRALANPAARAAIAGTAGAAGAYAFSSGKPKSAAAEVAAREGNALPSEVRAGSGTTPGGDVTSQEFSGPGRRLADLSREDILQMLDNGGTLSLEGDIVRPSSGDRKGFSRAARGTADVASDRYLRTILDTPNQLRTKELLDIKGQLEDKDKSEFTAAKLEMKLRDLAVSDPTRLAAQLGIPQKSMDSLLSKSVAPELQQQVLNRLISAYSSDYGKRAVGLRGHAFDDLMNETRRRQETVTKPQPEENPDHGEGFGNVATIAIPILMALLARKPVAG
jgi:hypothetical protein